MLSRHEFDAEVSAAGVIKLVGRDEGGKAVALATLSSDVTSFDWVNADFYEHRFGATPVFYVGLVVIDHAHQGSGLLSPLIDAIMERAHAAGAVVAFDLCAFNVSRLQLAEKALVRAQLLAPATAEVLDTQTYFCVSFDSTTESAA